MKNVVAVQGLVALTSDFVDGVPTAITEVVMVFYEPSPKLVHKEDGTLGVEDEEHISTVEFWATPEDLEVLAVELINLATKSRSALANVEFKKDTP